MGCSVLTSCRRFCSYSGMTISQARSGGFRFRTIDEIAQKRAQMEKAGQVDRRESDSDIDKKGSQEFVETV